MYLCRIKVTLENKPYPYMLLVIGEILIRSKGKNLAKEENLLPQILHFIYPLLKISDIKILNPLSTLDCQNGVVTLGLESLLHFFFDQKLPPSQWVCLVIWSSLMKSILPRQSISLFAVPCLSLDSTKYLSDCQVWPLDPGTMVAFHIFIKSLYGKSILFLVRACCGQQQPPFFFCIIPNTK